MHDHALDLSACEGRHARLHNIMQCMRMHHVLFPDVLRPDVLHNAQLLHDAIKLKACQDGMSPANRAQLLFSDALALHPSDLIDTKHVHTIYCASTLHLVLPHSIQVVPCTYMQSNHAACKKSHVRPWTVVFPRKIRTIFTGGLP